MILSKRLKKAADIANNCKIIADIGTDHAYLPIYLLENKKALFAYATDINAGPLKRAQINISKFNLCDKAKLIQTDGLQELDKYNIDTIFICGMGGDTIVEILDNAPFVKESNINIILQPMSAVERLRKYLNNNYFQISDETLCFDNGKYYFTLSVQFEKKIHQYTVSQLYLGEKYSLNDKTHIDYLDTLINKTKKIIKGKLSGNDDCETEIRLLNELEELRGFKQ